MTTMSKSKGMPLSSMSHWTFSRLMMYTLTRCRSAALRSVSVPTATE